MARFTRLAHRVIASILLAVTLLAWDARLRAPLLGSSRDALLGLAVLLGSAALLSSAFAYVGFRRRKP